MSVEYFAFPDRRESVGGAAPLSGEVPGDSVEFIEAMSQHAWEYPVLLVFREHQDAKWSFTLMMPNIRGEER